MAKVSFLYVSCTEVGKEEVVTISVFTETEFTTITEKKMYHEAREKLERVLGNDLADKCYLIG